MTRSAAAAATTLSIGGAAGDTPQGPRRRRRLRLSGCLGFERELGDTRDTILDFDDKRGDRIDLRPLDAKLGNGNQKFVFIGTDAFTGQKGQLRYDVDNGNAIVQADVTGDGKADMTILVIDLTKLTADDFHL